MQIELRIPHGDPEALDLALSGLRAFGVRKAATGDRFPGVWLVANVPNVRRELARALSVLHKLNVLFLRRLQARGVPVPPLYDSGIRYQREPDGREWWQTVLDNHREGEGDCEDLATHRSAELEVHAGEFAAPIAIKSGRRTYHAQTERGDGSIEDPSARLGMPSLERTP